MTSINNGIKIVSEFIQNITQISNVTATRTPISKNVFKIAGSKNCLLYVKSRSAYPLRWGVTANVIKRLTEQDIPWFVVLLFISHKIGYLLSSNDVAYYCKSVWPLGADGDYKPAEGSYLSKNVPFSSILGCINQL